jgi:hypothetical protein
LVEYTLWERGVAGSSPVSPIGGIMKENDKLPNIIAGMAIILYLVFLFFVTREKELQGGDIEKAIQTEQYR